MLKHTFPTHRYKHGKQNKAIALEVFSKMLKRVKKVAIRNYDLLTVQSFLAILYWSGLRKTEVHGAKSHRYVLPSCKRHKQPIQKFTEAIPGILKEDMWIKGDTLYVQAVARKHGSREAPLELWVEFPYVDLIVKQWERTPEGERVWPISEWDSWDLMKKIDAEKYPHFFRFNRITEMCLNPEMSVADICNWSGLTPQTVNKYMERSGRIIHSAAEKMRRQYSKGHG